MIDARFCHQCSYCRETNAGMPEVRMFGSRSVLTLYDCTVPIWPELHLCRWFAKKWRPASTPITIAAGIASLVGPACCPSLHGLYARLSGFSDGRVAVGGHRGHRHWDRRFCVRHRQQGRGSLIFRSCLFGLPFCGGMVHTDPPMEKKAPINPQ